MREFSKWMEEEYGYSWEKHKQDLIDEGFSENDITDEFLGLTYSYSLNGKEND